uniref:Myosin light chain 7 n=1 Tax=Ornithorhynchus anatinus TaxID=9258 RepID=A0A6I8N334_ORNAN
EGRDQGEGSGQAGPAWLVQCFLHVRASADPRVQGGERRRSTLLPPPRHPPAPFQLLHPPSLPSPAPPARPPTPSLSPCCPLQAFSCIDQNRDGIISKSDLKETFSQLGKLNVSDEELEEMLQEGKGPSTSPSSSRSFGEKLNGTDPEDSILSAFRMFDPNGTGLVNKDEFKQLLLTQADKFTPAEVEQMFAVTPIDMAGNIDYKSLCYIITHGDEKEE